LAEPLDALTTAAFLAGGRRRLHFAKTKICHNDASYSCVGLRQLAPRHGPGRRDQGSPTARFDMAGLAERRSVKSISLRGPFSQPHKSKRA